MTDSLPTERAEAGSPDAVAALEQALAQERERAREIDHRAKNTLQLVSSLILLLSRRTPGEDTRRVLRSLHRRVGAVASVHRGFLANAAPGCIDLTAFLRDQAPNLARGAPEGVRLQLDLDEVAAPASAAASLALIVGELVANAAAYAGEVATVTVALRRRPSGYVLSVTDDGPGLPAEPPADGFGLTMVRLLAQQIGARLELEDAQPGLRAVVTAP